MSPTSLELRLVDASATEALGAALATAYLTGAGSIADLGGMAGAGGMAGVGGAGRRGSVVVYLEGELGAGKTTCVRSLLRALGVTGLIRSPTYTLVELYELTTVTCVHVDLYRLQSPAEVDELGLRDYQETGCLLLVEWPEKGVSALPPPDVVLTLEYEGESRTCRLVARSELGLAWIPHLGNDRSLAGYVSNLT